MRYNIHDLCCGVVVVSFTVRHLQIDLDKQVQYCCSSSDTSVMRRFRSEHGPTLGSGTQKGLFPTRGRHAFRRAKSRLPAEQATGLLARPGSKEGRGSTEEDINIY